MVGDQPASELEKFHAEGKLRILCANVMRVVAGAGAPESIATQAIDFLRAEDSLRDKRGSYRSGQEIADALRVELPDVPVRHDEPITRWRALSYEQQIGEHNLCIHGLRVLAASLLSQDVQVRRWKSDFDHTLRWLIELREKRLNEVNPDRVVPSQKGRPAKRGTHSGRRT